jgi:Fe2+/Zn2+ uptake regulation proteins
MNEHKDCGLDCGCDDVKSENYISTCSGDRCAHEHPDLASELKARGLKRTRCREAILELLSSSEQPADAEKLHSELTERGFSINLSTVYRTLDTLCAAGFVSKLTIEGGAKALYEYNDAVHRHHLVCIGCKKITTIASCPLGGYEQRLESETGYTITGHKLDVYGYCPECRKDKK